MKVISRRKTIYQVTRKSLIHCCDCVIVEENLERRNLNEEEDRKAAFLVIKAKLHLTYPKLQMYVVLTNFCINFTSVWF